MPVARVIIDIPTRALDRPFDYDVPEGLASQVRVGVPVLVPFAGRTAVGYVVAVVPASDFGTLKPLSAVLGEPLFDDVAVRIAEWVSAEYVSTLADSLRLFLPPGGTPRVRRTTHGDGSVTWELERPRVKVAEERWARLSEGGTTRPLRANATMQRAVIDALGEGPVKVAELSAQLGDVSSALRTLEKAGAVVVESRRRVRGGEMRERPAPRHGTLSDGQAAALEAIEAAASGDVLALDGVTGSGKTEVYLRVIERVRREGGSAIVLVPEISLTPQTVGRFRSRFGDDVAVLHSRLTPGERFDQWDLAASGDARVVVGARSALFAPVPGLRLIVIDEEHESSYKQASAPRYHARVVAERLAAERGAVLVLGSATPSLETLHAAESGRIRLLRMPERVGGGRLPDVEIVDMSAEFADGNRSMFSARLLEGLVTVRERGEKAVVFLNRRGYAAFMLCRECGHVPKCASCSVSLTYHEVGRRLACHHCGSVESVPAACPRCGSPYLRQFGAGTQRVEAEIERLVPELPVVRMDADTTTGRGGHERKLAAFEMLDSGVLLGTQMVAKGLDYADVTLVGVVNADTTLHLPDFRSAERTYQLLEQVAGRAGRGELAGRVIIQTYWPEHVALRAVALRRPELLHAEERTQRHDLGWPPFARLVNVTVSGKDERSVRDVAARLGSALKDVAEEGWTVLGPSPSPIARLKGSYRRHVVVKAPRDAEVSSRVARALADIGTTDGVSVAPDIDPLDML